LPVASRALAREIKVTIKGGNLACGLTIIKKFTYRADTQEEWSNQYWFTGATPADATAWNTLRAAIVAVERTIYPAAVTVIGAYGYASDADGATAVYSLAPGVGDLAGQLSLTGGHVAPGDDAVWVRWKTSRTNTNGKPIYLRKYFHPAVITDSTAEDVLAAQTTALDALALKCKDGTLPDGRTITARGHTDTIVSSSSSPWSTTRTLKRRGKRPGS
jgi:hypothetical protein